ncbi:unnamed protein product [Prunus brigantina]
MGWSESGRGCKKHQLFGGDDMMMKQYSSPGVCSSCLSEKLSELYAPSSTFFSERLARTVSSPRNQSNSSSSSVSSSAGSPPVKNYYYSTSFSGRGPQRHHRRHASEILGSVSFMTRSSTSTGGGYGRGGHDDYDDGVMKKSRSVVSKTNHHRFGDQKASSGGGKQKKKKRGFWSKLLRTTGSKTKEVTLQRRNKMVTEIFLSFLSNFSVSQNIFPGWTNLCGQNRSKQMVSALTT